MPTAYVTAPPDAARDLSRTLVRERLAACVNLLPCDSIYRWDDAVHEDEEVVLLVKTTDDAYARLADRIEELHPYDVPCIERFEEGDVLPAFREWRDAAVE